MSVWTLRKGGQSGCKTIQVWVGWLFQHLIYFTWKLFFLDAHLLHLKDPPHRIDTHCGVCPQSRSCTYFQSINEARALPCLCNRLFCRALPNTGMAERVLLRPFNSWGTTRSSTPRGICRRRLHVKSVLQHTHTHTVRTHTHTRNDWGGWWWPISLYFVYKLLH